MSINRKQNISLKITMGAVLFSLLGSSSFKPAVEAAQIQPFADPAFDRVWRRTDLFVGTPSREQKRSWYWGPQPNTGPIMEEYAEGPGGKHLVQYFDKSRMEINNPNGDKSNPFYVTNGLLSRELISGYMQTGDNNFQLRWPAEIPVAGDTNVPPMSVPTYASFRGAIERVDANATGKLVNAIIFPNGALDFEHGSSYYMNYDRFNVKNAHYEPATKHNIPDVFWQFLNQTGPVDIDGKRTTARLSDPYFYVTGYPISDAYWSTIKIRTELSVPVLIQAYERRMLTYVPSASVGFKVEMGNVGQHYYDWRYKGAGKSPAMAGICAQGTPTLGFGKVYNENPLVKIRLGCQRAPEQREALAEQLFERGRMLSVSGHNFYSGMNYEDVYVLLNDGTAMTFPFNIVSNGEPNPTPVPPIGNYTTTPNFGLIYSTRNEVGTALGNATANAMREGLQGPPPKGGSAVQYFDGGLMVLTNFSAKKIYTLYNNSGYSYNSRGPHLTLININCWAAYDDTFQP